MRTKEGKLQVASRVLSTSLSSGLGPRCPGDHQGPRSPISEDRCGFFPLKVHNRSEPMSRAPLPPSTGECRSCSAGPGHWSAALDQPRAPGTVGDPAGCSDRGVEESSGSPEPRHAWVWGNKS